MEDVAFSGVREDILAEFVQALSRLQKVKRLKITSQANRSVGRPGNIFADVSMHDIQTVISNWPLLEELDVWGWVGTW